MYDEDKGYSVMKGNNSVSWYNNTGFYMLLDKIMTFLAVSRLEKNYSDWVNSLDTLASFTKAYWKTPEDAEPFDNLYNAIVKEMNSNTKVMSNVVRSHIHSKLDYKIRELHEILFRNISHMMIKTEIDDDDDPDWLKEADE
jgi:hypothetical protein